MPTELPLIVQQMSYAAERIERVIKGEDVAVLVFGPTGTGKTHLVIDLCRKHGVKPILCRDMTKAGFREMLRKHRLGHKLLVIDDSDEFMQDVEFCNLMKQVAVNERRRTITSLTHASLRDESDCFVTDCGLIVLTNNDPGDVRPGMRNHVQALKGRCPVVSISFEPTDLLRYIDYHVCERDYLRRKGRFDLATSQTILDTYHQYAWRLENIDFRALNAIADEARRSPDRWKDSITGILRSKPIRHDQPPPAPRIVPWTLRQASGLDRSMKSIDPANQIIEAPADQDSVAKRQIKPVVIPFRQSSN